MSVDIRVDEPTIGITGDDCERILRALPDWFGIEDATQHYIDSTRELPTILAYADDVVIGFMSLKIHNPFSAEIYVMGVHPDVHRQGVGRKMLRVADRYLRVDGIEYLQVKTLSDAHPDPYYAHTRRFYRAMAFRPVEEFPMLWGEANPCLLLIKAL